MNIQTVDEMTKMITDHKNFSFSRWGDGEWRCLLGFKGSNCDNHKYFPDMAKRLKEIIDSHPEYYLGLQNHAVRSHAEDIAKYESIDWSQADLLHRASIKGNLNDFYSALKNRDVLVIGPGYLLKVFKNIIIIPEVDCWLKYSSIIENIFERVKDDIVLVYCASMMANVMIDEVYNELKTSITQIDAGSVFDPYCGVNKRSYHRKLKNPVL